MPHLPQICPVCKNKDNFYFIKAFTGVSKLIAKLTFVRYLPKWAKVIEDEFFFSIANSVKVVISHFFAQFSKSDQNSFFNSFAQDSKSEQKFTLFVFRLV